MNNLLYKIHGCLHQNIDIAQVLPIINSILSDAQMDEAYATICQWENYHPTPLCALDNTAAQFGLRKVYYKDESLRFDLSSFKALGGAYAVEKLVQQHRQTGGTDYTVTTATDGNHGRSVAWGAARAGCKAKIFVHRHVSKERTAAIAAYGAEIIRTDGNYDDSVNECARFAADNDWQIVSDTSWEGYTAVPTLIMAGYSVLVRELLEQLDAQKPTHVIVPAGVGGLLAAVAACLARFVQPFPRLIAVESVYADCLLQSAKNRALTTVDIQQETLMAGLSCGCPSLLAWEIAAATTSDFISIDDAAIGTTMRRLAAGDYGTPLVGGECSAGGLTALQAMSQLSWDEKREFALNEDSVVLLFGTEGITDESAYRQLTQ
ncbi:diaminopropionate ammonia-lyase [Candidatus Persebacteraceae bacterium Df01]|uniref:Diaminopropionate ammonia-lyase n=1 Tax=Candidatus Doriopsillibacter californiensis TaxID=2970740 RepID=A0ABT7QKA6_9GAMM|nr:diaminopropionate ammonia-lyase [Candidatus Persebacteraceae bacterium Df01]